jgi:TP901 family phage tail tape measure protein
MASYDIVAKVRADMSQFITGLKSGEMASSQFATKMGGMGKAVAVGTAAAVAVAGIALYKLGEDFEKSYKKIRVATGATGEDLKGLEENFKHVFGKTAASMDDTSTAISMVAQKLGLTGKPLEDLSLQFLRLSKATGTDLNGNIESVTMAFKNFGVSADDQKNKLDLLYRASQQSGVPVAQLASTMSSSGVVLRQLGFDFDHSAALIGTFAKAGIDAGDVMPAFQRTLKSAAKEGKSAAQVFSETYDAIKQAPDATVAANKAMEVFGTRAGPKLAAAIQEGKLSYEDLLKTIESGGNTIAGAADANSTFGSKMTILGHQIMLAFEPIAHGLTEGLKSAMDGLKPVFDMMIAALKFVAGGFDRLPGPIKAVVPLVAAAVLAFRGFTALQGILGTAFAGIGAALDGMMLQLGVFVEQSLIAFGVEAAAAAEMGLAVAAALGPIGIALAVAFAAFTLFTSSTEEATKVNQAFTDTLDKESGAWTANTDAYIANTLAKDNNLQKLNDSGIGMSRWREAIENGTASTHKWNEVTNDASFIMTHLNDNLNQSGVQFFTEQLKSGGSTRDAFIADLANAGIATDALLSEFRSEAEAYDLKQANLKAVLVSGALAIGMDRDAAQASADARLALENETKAIDLKAQAQHAATDPVFAAIRAQAQVTQAQKDYNDKLAEGKATQADMDALLLARADAAQSYSDALGKLDAAQLKGESTNGKMLEALANLGQYGFKPTAEEAKRLRQMIEDQNATLAGSKDSQTAYIGILNEIRTTTVANSESVAPYIADLNVLRDHFAPGSPQYQNIQATIDKLTEFGNTNPVAHPRIEPDEADWQAWLLDHGLRMAEAFGPNSRKPYKAVGGLVTEGSPYIIGERGPEMFVPQVSGSIISADRVASMSVANGTGGNVTYVTNVAATVHLPAGANGRDVVNAITEFERRNGRVFARA